MIIKKKLLKFFSDHRSINFKKGELLIDPNKKIQGVYLLTEGSVRSFSVSPEGVERSINTFRPVSYFPMDWVLNNTTNRFFYDALENSKLYLAPKGEFLRFFSNNPDIILDLLTRIYKGLDGYLLRMETLLGATAYIKLVTQLVIQARRSGLKLRIPQRQLASETGLSRETITRELQKLQKKSLVNYQGNTLIVLNLKSLEDELTSNL